MAINVRIPNQRIYKMLRKQYPFSIAIISAVIETYSLTRPRRYQRDLEIDFKTIDRIVQGQTTAQIADEMNFNISTVQRRSDKFLMHFRLLHGAALDYDHMKKSLMT